MDIYDGSVKNFRCWKFTPFFEQCSQTACLTSACRGTSTPPASSPVEPVYFTSPALLLRFSDRAWVGPPPAALRETSALLSPRGSLHRVALTAPHGRQHDSPHPFINSAALMRELGKEVSRDEQLDQLGRNGDRNDIASTSSRLDLPRNDVESAYQSFL